MINNNGIFDGEKAIEAVLAYNQIQREDATITLCQLERDARGALYHIMLEACMLCYECYADAQTLEVLGNFSSPSEIYTDSMEQAPMSVCA